MRKFLLLLCAIICSSLLVMAQGQPTENEAEKPKDWKFSGIMGLNATTTGLINWAAGGNSNINGTAFSKLRLLYDKNVLNWETNLDLEYGLSYIDQKYDKFQKASDHIKFDTKFGWEFKKHWYLSALLSFQSQFSTGKKYSGDEKPDNVISHWLAPSYTDISLGIDWKPNDIFSVYLSPVAGRISTAYISDKIQNRYAADSTLYPDGLRQSLQEKYGVWHYEETADGRLNKIYQNAKAEFGLRFKGSVNYTYKDLKIITNLDLFTPYARDKTKVYEINGELFTETKLEQNGYKPEQATFKGYKDNNQRFGRFDVNWDLTVSYAILKYLNVSFFGNLKYLNGVKLPDKDGQNPTERVQLMGTLGLGVSYSF